MRSERIRVRGLVQGVGFRPKVWQLAQELGVAGDVRNDGEGVLIRACAPQEALDALCRRLRAECPPLARIDALERGALEAERPAEGFRILASAATRARTGVVADAALCAACAAEIQDPANRRFRYPFTNCTHCGPRLSILRAIPYDRANTSMAAFPLCPDCRREYQDPADRRFHAQPNACPACGPRVWLEDRHGRRFATLDPLTTASQWLARGRILAIKGLGGFHLACDAGNAAAVAALRRGKHRFHKPFALMARDLEVVRRYCRVNAAQAALLGGPAAPIVLLTIGGPEKVAEAVAPGQANLGFMLPYSPLHRLLLADWEKALVMTSGNRSEEPQCLDNAEARQRLGALADGWLLHDRDIVNRVDDSVVQWLEGAPRLLRRARGYAPTPLPLPPGFAAAPPLLALGGEQKNTFCLIQEGQAILSQHLGDLEEARTAAEYRRALALYQELFQHTPWAIAIDRHPDYGATQFGRQLAAEQDLAVVAVQHHHAHIASVLADCAWPREGSRVLGIALDGLGYGDGGQLWGGEFLCADYAGYERVGFLRPVALPGGVQAIREPWRTLYAQLATHLGWERVAREYPELALTRFLQTKPLGMLQTLLERGLNAPLSSSAGRLFDAVAVAVGLCPGRISYEGQAAIELEALARRQGMVPETGYPFARRRRPGSWILDPAPMWPALLCDLARGEPPGAIAARFHQGLARAVADLGGRLARQHALDTVALSGGVFQNSWLFEAVCGRLRQHGLRLLTPHQVPANDGGLALGQAVVAAAQLD